MRLCMLYMCCVVASCAYAHDTHSIVNALYCVSPVRVLRTLVLPAHEYGNGARDVCRHGIPVDASTMLDYQLYALCLDRAHEITFNDLSHADMHYGTFIILFQGNGVPTCRDNVVYNYAENILRGAASENRNSYVLRFTYRNVGASTGTFRTIDDLYKDGRAVCNYLINTHGIPAEHIICYGHSIGGAIATRVVADMHAHTPPKRCYLRGDRAIAYIDGFFPDRIIPREYMPVSNRISRFPVRMALRWCGLYPDVCQAWTSIPAEYKDFRNAINDSVIPQTASLYQAVTEHEPWNLRGRMRRAHNLITGAHMDSAFMREAWDGKLLTTTVRDRLDHLEPN